MIRTLTYDKMITFATVTSRKDTKPKNNKMLWSLHIARFETPTRSGETQTEYLHLPKDRQDELKDVGGYICAEIDGPRKAANVRCIDAIALDFDFGQPGLFEKIVANPKYAMIVHSTRKHTPEKPRLRVIIPLARSITVEEAEPIKRRIAADISMAACDDSTFDPARISYWPSVSRGAEYLFQCIDLPFADPDEILAIYDDWHDISSWPVSERCREARANTGKNQADPLGKKGVVGAFCRAFSVTAAIEAFLTDNYAEGKNGRFTYTKGSTSNGLVIYDDKFAYSHHGTDPASRQECNAFDLVRIHKFGGQDKDALPNTPGCRMPSYKAMAAFAVTLPAVKMEMAVEDFTEQTAEWKAELVYGENALLKQTIENTLIIMRNDPKIQGCVGYDQFNNRIDLLRIPPWAGGSLPRFWSDTDDAGLRLFMEKYYHITKRDKIFDALSLIMQENAFHPIRDFLNGLPPWDQVPRVDTLLIDILGADDSPYTRAVTRKWLVAAVTRVFEPGCKFDYILVIKGPQGIGKSRSLALLGYEDKGWFSDSPIPFGNIQGCVDTLSGKWIIELGEMSGLRKVEVEQIKSFVSSQRDKTRLAYDRRSGDFPRQCVFGGTTNRDDYLSDPTGNRRFWPVEVDPILAPFDREEYLPAFRDQIWAEALFLYKAGEKLYLEGKSEEEATERQTEHTALDERASLVREYLDRLLPTNWYGLSRDDRVRWLNGSPFDSNLGVVRRDQVCTLEIWVECWGKQEADLQRRDSFAISDIMKQFKDWTRLTKAAWIPGYNTVKTYQRNPLVSKDLTNLTKPNRVG